MPEPSLRSSQESAKRAEAPASGQLWERQLHVRREQVRRRVVVSSVRRVGRFLGLHLSDGALLLGLALVLTGDWAGGWPDARPFVPAIAAIFLLSLNGLGAYSPGDARRDRGRLLAGSILATLILATLALFPPHLPFSAGFLAAVALGGFVTLGVSRHVADEVVRQVYLRGIGLRRALLVGSLDEVSRAIQQLRDDRNIDQYLIGHLAPAGEADPTSLGTLEQLPDVVAREDVQELIITTELSPRVLREIAEVCFSRGIGLFVFPAVVGRVDYQAEPVRVGRCPLLHLYPPHQNFPSLLVKRVFDLSLATLALVLVSPLMLGIAFAIRLDSRGPVFFRQERVGQGGRRFRIWKFRSMHVDADGNKAKLAHLNTYTDPRLFKVPNDPRVTRVGRWLRRTSFDELPQLFNVLRGEMSLVGPRPPLPSEVADYEPHHFVRLAVVPGITGPWQVNGRNLITDFEEVVRLERAYIQSWSLTTDLKILLRTVPVVISGEGAY